MIPEGVKVLSESEIQDRLYGDYVGRRREPKPTVTISAARPTPQPGAESTPWTGTEILSQELLHLRRELLTLRQERERLEKELSRRSSSPAQSGPIWNLLGKGVGFFLLLGLIGYPLGVRLLQASPTGPEPSPYTVQVAVYDLRPAAERALTYLKDLGYPAFLVELPRRDGRLRYRIYVGQFVTKEEGSLEQERLTADPRFKDAFVRIQ